MYVIARKSVPEVLAVLLLLLLLGNEDVDSDLDFRTRMYSGSVDVRHDCNEFKSSMKVSVPFRGSVGSNVSHRCHCQACL